MQSQIARAARFGAVTIGSIAVMAPGADAASASTRVTYGTASTNPTSTSSLVPTGSTVGATGLVGSASFSAPKQGSGPTPTTGSCTAGSISGVLGTNPNTASPGPISLTSNTLSLSSCTDTGPTYDLVGVNLASGTAAQLQSGGSTSGTLTVINPTFGVQVRLGTSGPITSCSAVPVSGGNVVGLIRNSDGGVPTVEFSSVVVKATTTSGTCASAIGAANGATTPDRSTLSVKFGTLIGRSGASSNNRLGIFP